MTKKLFGAMLLVILTTYVAGCASYSRPATKLLDKGYDSVNFIDLTGRDSTAVVVSYGRVSGSRERSISPDDLVELNGISETSSTLRIFAALQDEVLATRRSVGLIREIEPNFMSAATRAIDKTIQTLPRVKELSPQVNILVAPSGSGYSVRHDSRVSNIPVTIFLAASTNGGDSLESVGNWWYKVSELVAHELLHLEQRLAGLNQVSTPVDLEVAAYMFGHCASARFVQELGVELTTGLKPNTAAFPGLTESIFAPDMDKIEKVGHASEQGSILAQAILYHLFMDEHGTLPLHNSERTAPLFAKCESLTVRTPAYTQGKLH